MRVLIRQSFSVDAPEPRAFVAGATETVSEKLGAHLIAKGLAVADKPPAPKNTASKE